MQIIKISALENGAHENQKGNFSVVREGWAIVPDDMTIPETFPFVNIEVENGVVVSMRAGVTPDPEPTPEPEPTIEDIINAMLGVSNDG